MTSSYQDEHGNVHVVTWEWNSKQDERPGLPWFGIFLVIFGGLLLLQQLSPDFREACRTPDFTAAFEDLGAGRSPASETTKCCVSLVSRRNRLRSAQISDAC